MKNFLYIAFLGLILLGNVTVQAQNNNPLEGQDSLVLENERINDVIDSDKPFIKPPYQEIKQGAQDKPTYQSQEFYVETEFEPVPPRFKEVDPDEKNRYKNNLLRLGIGRYTTPLAQLYINNGTDKDIDYGLNFTHLSAHNDEVRLRNFREDYGTIYAKAFQGGNEFYGKLYLYNTQYFNYAGDDTTLVEGDEQARSDSLIMGFTRFAIEAGVASAYDPDNEYYYDVPLDLRIYGDRRSNNEFNIGFKPKVGARFGEEASLGLDSELRYVAGGIGDSNQNRFFVVLNPAFQFKNDKFKAKVGINYSYFNNSIDSSGFSNLGPDIEASYAINPASLTAFVGVTSGMQAPTYESMIVENRFIARDVRISPTIDRYQVYLGVKGNINQTIDFSAKGYYRKVSNQLIYRSQDSIFFQALYDSSVNVTGAHLEVNYDLDENFAAGAALNIDVYGTSNQDSLTPVFFHATPVRLDVFGQYTFAEKLTTEGKLQVFGPTPMSVDETGATINRPLFLNIALEADYRPVDNVSVFVRVNNLLGSNFQRWFNYPERRFDIMGGVTIAF
ncbi:MAG: TonB-dependent receptor [Bacteroidota bacterium]